MIHFLKPSLTPLIWLSFFSLAPGAMALEPPDCEAKIHGSQTHSQNDTHFILEFSGYSSASTPPTELKLNDPDSSTLAFVNTDLLRHTWLYKTTTHLQEGMWSVEGMEDHSAIWVSSSPSTPLIEQGNVAWQIIDDVLIRENNPNLERKAEEALSLNIPIPSTWSNWNTHIKDNTLFHVLLAVDDTPNPQESINNTYLALATRGTIILKDPFERCRESAQPNWYQGERLRGLIWPLGMDPADISMSFELPLEEPRQSVRLIYGNDTEEEDQENKAPETHDDHDTGGCQTAAPGNLGMLLFISGLALFQRKRTSSLRA